MHIRYSAIERARLISHSQRTLHCHLIGTAEILERWGAPPHVIKAGLIHSIYSTEYFAHGIYEYSDRQLIKSIYGPVAESLSFYFSIAERERLWSWLKTENMASSTNAYSLLFNGQWIKIGVSTIRKLLLIECANFAEQGFSQGYFPGVWMSWILERVHFLPKCDALPHVWSSSENALTWDQEEEAAQIYRECFTDSRSISRWQMTLEKVSELNPLCGEPYVLRGLICFEGGDVDVGHALIQRGITLIKEWGISWDRRLSYHQWCTLPISIIRQGKPKLATLLELLFKGE